MSHDFISDNYERKINGRYAADMQLFCFTTSNFPWHRYKYFYMCLLIIIKFVLFCCYCKNYALI